MSDWRGHLKVGLTFQITTLLIIAGAYLYLKKTPDIIEIIFLLPVLMLSPLLPDIDHQSSKITLFFNLIGAVSLWLTYFLFPMYMIYSIIFISFVVIFSQFVPHRGITHKWWFILLIHTIFAVVTSYYALSIISFSGMISHLVADNIK